MGKSLDIDYQVVTQRGMMNGGTWMVEELAMEFARWLSPSFSIWCNAKIRDILTNGYAAISD